MNTLDSSGPTGEFITEDGTPKVLSRPGEHGPGPSGVDNPR